MSGRRGSRRRGQSGCAEASGCRDPGARRAGARRDSVRNLVKGLDIGATSIIGAAFTKSAEEPALRAQFHLVVEAWPVLSDEVRAGIVAMVKASLPSHPVTRSRPTSPTCPDEGEGRGAPPAS